MLEVLFTLTTMEKPSRLSRNYKKCVICNQRRTPDSNVYLARLPLDPDRCRKWVQAIGQEDLVHLPIEKLNQLKFVCNEHFQPEDFNKSRNRLLLHAVPTVKLPLKPLEDKLFEDFPLHIGQYPKHGSIENVPASNIEQDENIAQPVPDVVQDVTNLNSERLQTGLALKRKSNIFGECSRWGEHPYENQYSQLRASSMTAIIMAALREAYSPRVFCKRIWK